MPKPCGHASPDTSCGACSAYNREDYRLLWDGRPMADVYAASERIAAATGVPPLFARPGGSHPAAAPLSAPVVVPDRQGPCIHLGITVANGGGCRTSYECERGHGVVRRCAECRTCEDYRADGDESPAAAPETVGHDCGVAIGSFRWPELVELQVKLIRKHCGPVPVLVSNDDPAAAGVLGAICGRFADVTLSTNPERIGHTGGDIAVFHKAMVWAARRRIRVVAKLSQRFLIDRPNWLQDGARDLLASGLPLASRRATGVSVFDLRTEACLLDTARWAHAAVLARTAPRRYWADVPTGIAAERVIFRVLEDLLGGHYWPWAAVLGEERVVRDFPDVLWHDNTPAAAYHATAAAHGVALPPGFHCGGWEKELAAGQYLYG